MPICDCGCGEMTKGGVFLPGHDQRLRARLESAMGGLLNLRDLVEAHLETRARAQQRTKGEDA